MFSLWVARRAESEIDVPVFSVRILVLSIYANALVPGIDGGVPVQISISLQIRGYITVKLKLTKWVKFSGFHKVDRIIFMLILFFLTIHLFIHSFYCYCAAS